MFLIGVLKYFCIYGTQAGSRKTGQSGFTLIELAIVMVIGGIILAGMSTMLLTYIKNANIKSTQHKLAAIDDAMQHYLSMNGRLPCVARFDAAPDTAGFGHEITDDCNDGAQAGTQRASDSGNWVRMGAVPTRTINLPDDYAMDAWGNRFTYAVTEELATEDLYDRENGAISIVDSNDNTAITPAGSGHYVVVSHDPDGAGSYTISGVAGPSCQAGTLDHENCNGTTTFRRTMMTAHTNVAGHYDDFIIYRASSAFGQTIPSGAIMAFNLSACPPGWSLYAAAAGRTIVGTGDLGGETYNPDDTGGQAFYTLSLAQMGLDTTAPGDDPPPGSINYAYRTVASPDEIDNRPPYIALTYCVKN